MSIMIIGDPAVTVRVQRTLIFGDSKMVRFDVVDESQALMGYVYDWLLSVLLSPWSNTCSHLIGEVNSKDQAGENGHGRIFIFKSLLCTPSI